MPGKSSWSTVSFAMRRNMKRAAPASKVQTVVRLTLNFSRGRHRLLTVRGMNLAIETVGLTRRFGDLCAVDAIDLRVERGTFYGFLGPNGAGKSTTIKMLTGLLAPTSGAMRLLGEDLGDPERARAVKGRVGVVPENLALFENLTAREYLTFIGRMYLLPPATVRERTDELLTMMDLDRGGEEAGARILARDAEEAGAGGGAAAQPGIALPGRAV